MIADDENQVEPIGTEDVNKSAELETEEEFKLAVESELKPSIEDNTTNASENPTKED